MVHGFIGLGLNCNFFYSTPQFANRIESGQGSGEYAKVVPAKKSHELGEDGGIGDRCQGLRDHEKRRIADHRF